MSERIRIEEEAERARSRPTASRADEQIVSAAAVFDAAGRGHEPGRGSAPAVGRAIGGLHASAGNGAIARLFEAAGSEAAGSSREGQSLRRAGRAEITGGAVVQREAEDETAAMGEAAPTTDVADAADASASAGSATELAGGAPAHGPSWTRVGPPSNTTYNVTGTLRDAANTVSARTEAGSVTATPARDIETWAPDGGDEKITAARVTIAQVMELPTWTDKSTATKNQQAEWDRFHAAITTHENGHVSTDKTAFAGTHSAMVGRTPSDGDANLDVAAEKAKTANDTYDTTTKHGLAQGTGINPNIDEVTKVP